MSRPRASTVVAVAVAGLAVLTGTGAGAVAAGSIPGSRIELGSITGRQLRDGGLGTTDVAPATVRALRGPAGPRGAAGESGVAGPPGDPGGTGGQGPDGATGLTGPTGPAGADGISAHTTRTDFRDTTGGVAPQSFTVRCPTPTVVVGVNAVYQDSGAPIPVFIAGFDAAQVTVEPFTQNENDTAGVILVCARVAP